MTPKSCAPADQTEVILAQAVITEAARIFAVLPEATRILGLVSDEIDRMQATIDEM
jgi:hypothetical protein